MVSRVQPPATARINWNNPFSKHLRFAWIGPHTGGEQGRDLVSGIQGVVTEGGSGGGRSLGPHGHQVTWPNAGSGNQIEFAGLDIGDLGASGYTVLSFCSSQGTDAWQTMLAFGNASNHFWSGWRESFSDDGHIFIGPTLGAAIGSTATMFINDEYVLAGFGGIRNSTILYVTV